MNKLSRKHYVHTSVEIVNSTKVDMRVNFFCKLKEKPRIQNKVFQRKCSN